MDDLIAYRCMECGHYTISKHDGIRCAKCGGEVAPAGNATYADKKKNNISISVELTGYEKFKGQLNDIEAQLDRIDNKSQKIVSRPPEPPSTRIIKEGSLKQK